MFSASVLSRRPAPNQNKEEKLSARRSTPSEGNPSRGGSQSAARPSPCPGNPSEHDGICVGSEENQCFVFQADGSCSHVSIRISFFSYLPDIIGDVCGRREGAQTGRWPLISTPSVCDELVSEGWSQDICVTVVIGRLSLVGGAEFGSF